MPSQSFSPPDVAPLLGRTFSKSISTMQVSILRGASNDDDGTGWIKDSMGSQEGENSSAAPPPNEATEFTQDEMDGMDKIVISLSKESDDDKRRQRLAEILDQILAGAPTVNNEIPRFAKLFQLSLDTIGGEVQTDARGKALVQQQQNEFDGEDVNDTSDGTERVKRVKSPEELQLWSLIDMMVQSKTRVKLHMGSIASEGQFL